jgi:metal transporter CNNM
VFVDVHKAIRRIAPAPRTRYTKGDLIVDAPATDDNEAEADERTALLGPSTLSRKSSLNGARETTLMMRRRSSTSSDKNRPLPVRSSTADLRQHLKHLGPSNVASRPKATKYTSVKIKPGVGTIPENHVPALASARETDSHQSSTAPTVVNGGSSRPEGGEGTGVVDSAGVDAKDGAHAVAHGHGTPADQSLMREEDEMHSEPNSTMSPKPMTAKEASAFADRHTVANLELNNEENPRKEQQEQHNEQENGTQESHDQETPELPQKMIVKGGTSQSVSDERRGSHSSHSTLGEMEDLPGVKSRRNVRSGSITENIVDVGGMKKVVLEANSSSEGDDQKPANDNDGANDKRGQNNGQDDAGKDSTKKKKKKKRGGKKFRNKGDSVNSRSGDSTPR